MVEVALEDRVMAKMYGRVVYKFMKDMEVRQPFVISLQCDAKVFSLSQRQRMVKSIGISWVVRAY